MTPITLATAPVGIFVTTDALTIAVLGVLVAGLGFWLRRRGRGK